MLPARCVVDAAEVAWSAIRAQGPGGQNVNKVSSAVQLRFDVAASSLPEAVKARLLALRDGRVNAEGVVVIKAQATRSQERNKAEALQRLQAMVDSAAHVPTPRKATRPTFGARQRRLADKSRRGDVKAGRGRVDAGA